MRNIVVTGASRGLGLAIATRLVSSGYRVIGVARTESLQLRSAMQALQSTHSGALQFRAFDLADIDAMAPLVRQLREDFGPLHGLVNNAGLGTNGLLATMRDEDIERLVRINTVSPVILTKYVARSMMSECAGRIVNIASVVSSTGYIGLAVYSATNASLVGFTR